MEILLSQAKTATREASVAYEAGMDTAGSGPHGPGERPSGGGTGYYHSIIGETILTGSGSGNKKINYKISLVA